MKQVGQKYELSWEFSLVIWIFLSASIWVIIRFLDEYFLIFQQVFLRSSIAVILSIWIYIFFFWKIHFKNILVKDYAIFFMRSIFHLAAIGLWILALLNTSLANATLVWSIPATAILGILFFWNKIKSSEVFFLLIAFFGVITISFDENLSLWVGELYAFCASFCFSAYSLSRKLLSDHLWDREISVLSLTFSSVLSFFIVLLLQNDTTRFQENYSIEGIIYLFLGAILFLCISFFWIYGFKRVTPIKASSIEFLEIPFAIILGFIFFWEYLSFKEIFWGILIVLWAYFISIRNK